MIEGLYGHVTEKNPRNNPKFLQFSKRVATEAFHLVIPVVTSGSPMCQNAREQETSSEALWAMFQQRHEHCFTSEDLGKVKTNLENGKDIHLALLRKQLYIRTMAFCRRYVSMMLGRKGNLTNEQRAKLRDIHVAITSRPMKWPAWLLCNQASLTCDTHTGIHIYTLNDSKRRRCRCSRHAWSGWCF